MFCFLLSLLTLLIPNNWSVSVLFVNSTYFFRLWTCLVSSTLSSLVPYDIFVSLDGPFWFFWVWFLQDCVFITLWISKKHHFERVRPFVHTQLEWDVDLGRPFRRGSSKGLTLTKRYFSCLVKPTVLTITGHKVTSMHCSLYLLTVQWHPYCAHAYADAVKSFYLRS